ncbi:hypothetical protein ABIB40_002740 [Pedobacter sp. UYP30]|uniref:SusE domain-containing protein n=1 Tax=Pedobacter sp. UYP30 TaxID=1756400 RepID=UPI00339792A8
MKKYILLTVLAISCFACKKENLVSISKDAKGPTLVSPSKGATGVVTPADSTQKVKFTWQKADYGVNTVLTYSLQMGVKGSNFSKAINLATTEADSLSVSLGALNSYAINVFAQTPNADANLIFRVSANLSGRDTTYSQTLDYKLTTYKEVASEFLYVPGVYQNWLPGTADKIVYKGNSSYEGYVNMPVGDYFKFTNSPDWDHINFGSGGAGKLSTDGKAEGLKVNDAGYYKFSVNTKDLTWSSYLVHSWGIAGSATPKGWDFSTDMTYDKTTKKWSVTVQLVPGAVKFRANDKWTLNYGPANSDAFTGTLIQTDGAVTITDAGKYKIEADFSQTSKKDYLYTVTKL